MIRSLSKSLRARLTPRPAIPVGRWDEEFQSGAWAYLTSEEQLPRYAVIGGFCQRLLPASGGFLLDVGCGEGVLLDHLAACPDLTYTGLDHSEVAIEKARARISNGAASVRFSRHDANHAPDLERKPDVVILNEVLYYLERPVEILSSYLHLVGAAGSVVVSICGFENQCWLDVSTSFASSIVRKVMLTDEANGKTWHIAVFHGAQ